MIDPLGRKRRRRKVMEVRNSRDEVVFGASPGDLVAIFGAGFGPGPGRLQFMRRPVTQIIGWTDTRICCVVPDTGGQPIVGIIRVTTAEGAEIESDFTFTVWQAQPAPDPMARALAILGRIETAQGELDARLQRMENTMATQADIDALNTSVQGMSAAIDGLGTDLDNIDAGIQALKNANPGVDVTALTASVTAAQEKLATADTHAQTIATGLAPAPAPTPAPTP